jgi:hypothetical protein
MRKERVADITHERFGAIYQDLIDEEIVILGHNFQDNSWYKINSFLAPHELLNDFFVEEMIRISPRTAVSPNEQLIAFRDRDGLKIRDLWNWKLVASIDDLRANSTREPNEISISWNHPAMHEFHIANWRWSQDSKKLMIDAGRQPFIVWNLEKLNTEKEIVVYDLGDNEEYWYGIGWLPNNVFATYEFLSTTELATKIALIYTQSGEVAKINLNEYFSDELGDILIQSIMVAPNENKLVLIGLNGELFQRLIFELENSVANWDEGFEVVQQEMSRARQQWIYDLDLQTLQEIDSNSPYFIDFEQIINA